MILTLPFVFSLLGMTSGIILQLSFATLALYTNYLLMAMHTEYRHIINTDPKHPKHGDKDHIVSYYGINIITNTHTPTHTHMFINICILQYMGDIASFFSSLQFLLSCFSVKTQCTRLLEIISYLVSPRAGTFAQVVVYVALIGLSTVQVSFEER